jgi:hypothetical protein
MARKPTGGKPGRPAKPINELLKAELSESLHNTSFWHSLFDTYEYLESVGASNRLLTTVQKLIETEFASHGRSHRNARLLHALQDKLSKVKTVAGQYAELMKFTSSKLPKSQKFDQHILKPLREIRKRIRSENRTLNRSEWNWLREVERQGEKVSTELEFIYEQSIWIAREMMRTRAILLKSKRGLSTVYFRNTLDESDAEVCALGGVEKILKSGDYDITWSKKAKVQYIRTAVNFVAFDLYRKRKGQDVPDEHEIYDESEELEAA